MAFWHNNKEKILVPVLGTDTRSYVEKWSEKSYLSDVKNFGTNSVFISEVLESLKIVRDKMDNSENPEHLKGCAVGVMELKKLLTLSKRAEIALKQVATFEKDAAAFGETFSR